MKSELEKIRNLALQKLKEIDSAEELEKLRVEYLGRKGILKELSGKLPSLPPEDKPVVGKMLNELKTQIAEGIKTAERDIGRPGAKKTHKEMFDVTLPGDRPAIGAMHPITKTIREIRRIFSSLGFEVAYGPQVELEYYNFEALNIPLDHVSREAFDTFYLKSGALLRSQTSTVQVRVMEHREPPIRIIAPGTVYRPDTVDASHSFMFHQVEGLAVDEGVTFADLKHVLVAFAKRFFGDDLKMRLRPSFFPFTEPSAEVDISCIICHGKGCSVCSQSGWLEVLGCGMVDPNVFKAVGYDAEKYTGFAFGMGIERLAMMKMGINDIRLFMENDIRFLNQFRGAM